MDTKNTEQENVGSDTQGIQIPHFDKNSQQVEEVYVQGSVETQNQETSQNTQNVRDDSRMMTIVQSFFFLALTLALLTAGYFVFKNADMFLFGSNKVSEKKLVFENDLVRADTSRVVSIEAGAVKDQIQKAFIEIMKNEEVAQNTLTLVTPSYLREKVIGEERSLVSEPQRGDEFMFVFLEQSPVRLKTVTGEKYAMGVVGTEVGNKNFITLSVSAPQEAIAELRRYELAMYTDLKGILNLHNINGTMKFEDLSQNNHILRVARDDDGIVFVYGFGAPRTVILAPDANTFEFVFSRLK
jgi:hypothetical protein